MNRHTDNPLQNLSKLFKKFLLASLSLGFLYLGAYACIGGGGGPGGPGAPGGGGISPVGGLGSGGMGAPPLAIPAPEALNMTAIIVAAPDTGGNSTVTVSPGAGPTGDFIVVRNRGDIVALAPWRRLLLGRAYAAGQTVTRLILPSGDTFTIGAAAGEELEFFHCLKNDINRCSQGFLISAPATGTTQGDTSAPATPPSGGVIKSITSDPGTGDTYILKGSSRKKWDWKSLWVGSAHAAEGGDDDGVIDQPEPAALHMPANPPSALYNNGNTNLYTNGVVNSAVQLDLYTTAVCPSLPGGVTMVPDPSLSGKTCSIALAQGNASNSNDPNAASSVSAAQNLIDVSNCDPSSASLVFYNENGEFKQKRLALYSKNVLWLINANEKRVTQKIAYWSNIDSFQYLHVTYGAAGNTMFTTLSDPTKADLPSLAINHECDTHPDSAGIKRVGGFTSTDGYVFMTANYQNESCILEGVWGSGDIQYFTKIEPSCRPEPLTGIAVLPWGTAPRDGRRISCGHHYVTLSPSTKQLHHTYLKTNLAEPACAMPSRNLPLAIPQAESPVAIAFNGSDTLVVLDSTATTSTLLSFRVEQDTVFPENYKITYDNRIALPGTGGATQVLWNPRLATFITNLTPPEGGAVSTTSTLSLRRVEAVSTSP